MEEGPDGALLRFVVGEGALPGPDRSGGRPGTDIGRGRAFAPCAFRAGEVSVVSGGLGGFRPMGDGPKGRRHEAPVRLSWAGAVRRRFRSSICAALRRQGEKGVRAQGRNREGRRAGSGAWGGKAGGESREGIGWIASSGSLRAPSKALAHASRREGRGAAKLLGTRDGPWGDVEPSGGRPGRRGDAQGTPGLQSGEKVGASARVGNEPDGGSAIPQGTPLVGRPVPGAACGAPRPDGRLEASGRRDASTSPKAKANRDAGPMGGGDWNTGADPRAGTRVVRSRACRRQGDCGERCRWDRILLP
jgi:hypothetical protein